MSSRKYTHFNQVAFLLLYLGVLLTNWTTNFLWIPRSVRAALEVYHDQGLHLNCMQPVFWLVWILLGRH